MTTWGWEKWIKHIQEDLQVILISTRALIRRTQEDWVSTYFREEKLTSYLGHTLVL